MFPATDIRLETAFHVFFSPPFLSPSARLPKKKVYPPG